MAAVLGIPRKKVLSRSFLRKTLSWGMTGKNVDTLNTKSCLNMIYNGLFIPTLPDPRSSEHSDFFSDVTRISGSRQYNPVLMQWSWKSTTLCRFSSFHDVAPLRCQCLLFVQNFLLEFIWKIMVNGTIFLKILWNFLLFTNIYQNKV